MPAGDPPPAKEKKVSEIFYFLSGVCVAALLFSVTSAVIVYLIARHGPLIGREEDDDDGQ